MTTQHENYSISIKLAPSAPISIKIACDDPNKAKLIDMMRQCEQTSGMNMLEHGL
jgi:hypothetical protein